MNEVKVWVIGACFAAAACALLELICPSGKMQKSARTVTAVFFLCAVLLPAGKALRSISLSAGGTVASVPEELSSRVAEQSRTVAQQSVQNLIRSLLGRHSVTPRQVLVTVETDNSGAIAIQSARVLLSKTDFPRAEEISGWILTELGLRAECQSAE